MTDPAEFIVWPMADPRVMFISIGFALALLGLAVAIELNRRRRAHTILIESQWRGVRDIFDERDIQEEDRNLMLAILRQYTPQAPLRGVTRQSCFNECMDHYFRAIQTIDPPEKVAERGVRLREIRARLGLDYVPIGRRIHSTRELYDAQILWTTLASGEEPRWFNVRVTDVNEASFQLAPVGAEDLPDARTGDRLKFRLWREDDARYLFETSLTRVDQRPARWRAAHTASLVRTQARAHFRIRFDAPAEVAILNAPISDKYEGIQEQAPVIQLHGRITSLSGGGLAIQFPQPLPKQILMRVPLNIPGVDRSLVAFVRPAAARQLGGGQSLVRGRFVAMDDDTRDVITRYIFHKQKLLAGEDRVSA